MRNNDLDRVVPLDQLEDFEVAEGNPDVRGWEVLASDGRKIGEVDQLLVDPGARKVRYLDVDVNDDILGDAANRDRHVLIPIGYARLDEGSDRVIVDTLVSADVVGLPEYTHGPVTRDFEADVRRRFDTGFTGTAERDFYEGDSYDENRFYGRRAEGEARMTLSEEELAVGKREVETGEVELRKRVETEHVAEPVTTRHEEVTVERRPITDPMQAREARIEGDEIHVPLHEEEAVVQKRVVPREELVVRKQEVEETETVEADLRRERVDLEREGDARIRDDGLNDRR
jgi:uncharacterized protein (TIGR02271 family)